MRRLLGTLALVGLVVFGPAAPALADPAGPTDYRTEVASIVPETDGVDVEVLGGDAFVQVTAAPGVEVEVAGYQGEPYLRFLDTGVVESNLNAPSTYVSEDRFGETEVPDFASVEAAPDWSEVATGGRYAWHDHRAHWMNSSRPPGNEPGDQILEAVVPLRVDGQDVDVVVQSFWEPSPSAMPTAVGALGGVLLALGLGLMVPSGKGWTLLTFGLAATAVGWSAVQSLPAEAAPPSWLWIVPASVAVLGVMGTGIVPGLRTQGVTEAATLVAGLELLMWGIVKREWLFAAILPTDLPTWLDRAVTAAAAAGAVTVLVMLLRPMLAAPPPPAEA